MDVDIDKLFSDDDFDGVGTDINGKPDVPQPSPAREFEQEADQLQETEQEVPAPPRKPKNDNGMIPRARYNEQARKTRALEAELAALRKSLAQRQPSEEPTQSSPWDSSDPNDEILSTLKEIKEYQRSLRSDSEAAKLASSLAREEQAADKQYGADPERTKYVYQEIARGSDKSFSELAEEYEENLRTAHARYSARFGKSGAEQAKQAPKKPSYGAVGDSAPATKTAPASLLDRALGFDDF